MYSSTFIQARIKIDRGNINNLRYARDITLMAESEEERKNLLMKVKEESERRRWKKETGFLWTDSMDMSLGKLGVGNGQGGLAYCSSWGCKELDTTDQLNWTELKILSRGLQDLMSLVYEKWPSSSLGDPIILWSSNNYITYTCIYKLYLIFLSPLRGSELPKINFFKSHVLSIFTQVLQC